MQLKSKRPGTVYRPTTVGLQVGIMTLLVLLWASVSFGGTFVALQPTNVVRTTGNPVPVPTSFTVLNPNTTYTLRINNGGLQGQFARVSSAVVTLNGVEVVRPSDFNQTVTLIEKPLTLSTPANTVSVELRSAPGSGITFQVIGVDNDLPTITATTAPPPNAAGWQRSPVTVSFSCADVTSGIAACSAPTTVATDGANQRVSGTATDRAGNSSSVDATVQLDTTPPSVALTAPPPGLTLYTPELTVTGTVNDGLSGVAGVTCNGSAAGVTGTTWQCPLTLTEGVNTLVAQATDVAGNTSSATRTVTFVRVPQVTISSPSTGAYLNTPVVTISGTVGDPAAQVNINGIVTPVSNARFAAAMPLSEGPNTVTAVATNSNGTTSTASVVITLDTTAPRVAIYSPPADGSTTTSAVNVTGLVNDIVVGTVNPEQATVTVNGVTAQVSNRSFLAADVPLALGANTIQAVATDRVGNRATASIGFRRTAVTGQPALTIFSGNGQGGPAGSVLPAPLVVKFVDAAGMPQVNKPVVFRVINQDGMVSTTAAADSWLDAVAVNTDSQGQAGTQFRLGRRAGVGNNLVEASVAGAASTVDFTATATAGGPHLVVVDSGNNQSGVVGQPLPLPFIAIVTDGNNNRLPNIPMTFTVLDGAGNFAGSTTLETTSDGDGRVAATLTLGPHPGVNANLVQVNFAGNTGSAAAFMATGLVPGPADETRISGVVLDNSNNPIPGVTMRLLQINQGNRSNIPQEVATAVRTDAQGQFVMQPVPVGVFKLMADGGTAQRSGTWPTLEYDMITVSGQNNTLGVPVYLPELLPTNRLCVSETTGGTLTIPQAPGFALTIAAGSATFPGGSRAGCVSVTPVNMDKVPMAPGFGQQPRFIVTIQPVGTVFSPPAQMTIPNVDGLAPRAVTEMYSYDHDLAAFVAIGSATVSADGATITSDPGSGVIKAGWHCGGDPNVTGSCGTCSQCQQMQGNQCVVDDNMQPSFDLSSIQRGSRVSAVAAVPVIIAGGIVLTEAEAIAAAFGLSLSACLATPACRQAVFDAVNALIDNLGRAALRVACEVLHAEYVAAEALCRSCNVGRALTCLERVARCAEAVANEACWAAAVAGRAAYIASGCDFILNESYDGHVAELTNKRNALARCDTSIANNCF